MSVNGHGPLEKLTLVNLDRSGQVVAQYNPKEFQLDKAASWSPTASRGDQPELTFQGSNPRTLQLELFFDTYETGEDVHARYVGPLQELALVMPPNPATGRSDEADKRPPRVAVIWGGGGPGGPAGGHRLPRFIGVVESVAAKYTMFLPDGTAVRATCAIKLLEADRASFRVGAPR